MRAIPVCVIAALTFSLLESTLVLPAHLAHHGSDDQPKTRLGRFWLGVQALVADGLARFIKNVYQPSLAFALEWRYLTVALGMASLILTSGLIAGGWVKTNFFPSVEADNVGAYLTMPQGTPARITAEAIGQLEASARKTARELEEEYGEPVVKHIMASVGAQPYKSQQERGGISMGIAEPHIGEVNVALVQSEQRSISSAEVMRRWRESVTAIPGAAELTFSSSLISGGEAINVQLQGPSIDDLRIAADRLKAHLQVFPGVEDIADSFNEGKREIVLRILPSAEALGLTMTDLGRQVRQAFYGEEVQRIQRGRDEVRVMVRYPASQRRSMADIENMRIRTPEGTEIPFRAVAEMEMGRGFATIRRADRRRVINVTADVDESLGNANEILATLKDSFLPQLVGDFHGLSYSFEGEQRERTKVMAAMARGLLLSLLAIYALLAIPLRSYIQPLIIMSAIPFGLIGAIWGHFLLNWQMSMFSTFGIVALTGVVVNDSLVMVTYVNQHRASGTSLVDAVREAGTARFRPILLTSLTTFFGLVPLLMEKSVQAQLIIPMALSLAFGVLFATVITLLIVPAIYLIIEDARALRLKQPRGNEPLSEPQPAGT
jgi:multidrug efflux pump subunit AcrB